MDRYEHAKKAFDKILEKGYTISFAESCTGGMAAETLVSIPDASKVFNESYVTYSNESKVRNLGVGEDTIEEFGVVSREVACEMAKGVAKKAGADVGVGVSGIAGPLGGTKDKPVGCVCFGFYVDGKTVSEKMLFGDLGRNVVREKSTEHIFKRLSELL